MGYTRTIWQDKYVQTPNKYNMTNNGDGTVTLTEVPGTVYAEGTSVNAQNLNNIEEGILQNEQEINEIKSEKSILSNTPIYGGVTTTVANISDYNKIAVTYALFNEGDITNTGGNGNVLLIDLSNDVNGKIRAGDELPYITGSITSPSVQTQKFGIVVEIDKTNNTITACFIYNGAVQTRHEYYISQITGYKEE